MIESLKKFFQPLKTPLRNRLDYGAYLWRQNPGFHRILRLIGLAVAVISFALDVLDFFTENDFWLHALWIIGLVLPVISAFLDFVRCYEEQFTETEEDSKAYEDVYPPDNSWERWDILIGTRKEAIFRSEEVDDWFCGAEEIGMKRNREYEKSLRAYIQDKKRWEKIYAPFLRRNYIESKYKGKQFYNEEKFGISSELVPHMKTVQVHKTCYYDSYLTNTIPGSELRSSRDEEVIAKTVPELMPYREHPITKEKCLCEIGERQMANEPGVTTLCILPNNMIRLWHQNRMAQCSMGLLVASGSGSADWKDCKEYLGESNGLRKAIIHGMERELWEESDGDRKYKLKEFRACVDTRITGYFRWLKKAGKSEFVGVSCLHSSVPISVLSPETSEVNRGADIPARTIWELKDEIDGIVTKRKEGSYITENCNVSCTMAMLSLKRLCEKYCEENCVSCERENCPVRPYDALFPEP